MMNRRIGIDEVELRVNKKKSTIYARIKANLFPPRNADGWLESDIDYYVEHGCWPPVASNDHAHASAA